MKHETELAGLIEDLCRENFVLKLLVKNHVGPHWRDRVELNTQAVAHRFQGKIGGDFSESLERLRTEIDEEVDRA